MIITKNGRKRRRDKRKRGRGRKCVKEEAGSKGDMIKCKE
jgi:hypothetical protein